MAYSYNDFTGDGFTVVYPISFEGVVDYYPGYLDEDHVFVEFDGIVQDQANRSFDTPTQIQLIAAPPSGTNIRFQRVSSITETLVDFEGGAQLSEKNLDKNTLQMLFLTQESYDIGAANTTDVELALAAALAAQAAAEAAEAAAVIAQDNAEVSASTATTKAAEAVVSADAAESSAAALNYVTDLEAAVANAGFTEVVLRVNTAQTLTGALVIPENLVIEIDKGGSINGAYTLTFNGQLNAGDYNVFGDSVTVLFTNQESRVVWFLDTNAGVASAIKSVGATLLGVVFEDKTYTLTSMAETFPDAVNLYGSGNTIINGATSWTFNDSILINNIKFTNSDHGAAGAMITLSPPTGSTIDYYRFINVDWDTMYSAIRGVTDLTCTVTNIEMNNCNLSNITRYGWRQETKITSGNVSYNSLKDFGDLVTYGGTGFLFGSLSIWADITDINIHHNRFDTISGPAGAETHAALMYGHRLRMEHNKVKDILGTGEDHEALYMKAYDSSISYNFIDNGCGDASDGAITFKQDYDAGYGNKIVGNNITGAYAKIRSNSGALVSLNYLNGTTIASVRLTGGALQYRYVITDNIIISAGGIALYCLDIKNSIISGNTIESVGDGIQFTLVTELNAAEDTIVINNNIDTAVNNIDITSQCSGLRIIDNNLTGGGNYIGSAVNVNGEIRGNTGYVTEAFGAATLMNDGNTITHGLLTTPTYVNVTGTVIDEIITASAVGNPTFAVRIRTNAGAAGTQQTIYWEAKYKP